MLRILRLVVVIDEERFLVEMLNVWIPVVGLAEEHWIQCWPGYRGWQEFLVGVHAGTFAWLLSLWTQTRAVRDVGQIHDRTTWATQPESNCDSAGFDYAQNSVALSLGS